MAAMKAAPAKIQFILALACTLLAGCERPPDTYRTTIPAFGTLLNLTLPESSRSQGNAVAAVLQDELFDLHMRWHAWKPGELSQLNDALARGDSFEASEPLAQILGASRKAYTLSQGLFDPAQGHLVRMWGFHTDHYPVLTPEPENSQVETWLGSDVSFGHVTLAGNRISSSNTQVQFDFGAIAKGMALDRLFVKLSQLEVKAALLEFGGDVGAYGIQGNQSWRVAVADPSGLPPLVTVELHNGEFIMTSGTYARFRASGDAPQSHLLNPRTGRPARGLTSATVIHRIGHIADAAATALVVAGPSDWMALADAMDIQCALVVHESGKIQATEALAARLTQHGSIRMNRVAAHTSESEC